MGHRRIDFLPMVCQHERVKTTRKRPASLALVALLLAVLLSVCGCANLPSIGNTSADSPEQSSADIVQPQSPAETSAAVTATVDLPVMVTANFQYLADKGNGVYSVGLPDEGVDYPAMPTYTWYINGTESDAIADVVLEFDLIDTVAPLDNEYFGYDRGYFITLHNFETIPLTPSWWEGSTNNLAQYGDTDRAAMILMPELGVDLQKFVTTEIHPDDTAHVQIVIPYSQFQTASKDLTLQFLPGTIYGNLAAYVRGNGLTETTVERISQTIDYGTFDHEEFKMEMLRNFNAQRGNVTSKQLIPDQDLNPTTMGSMIENTQLNQTLFVNPDGSVNMHVSFYNLGEYADEIQGEYVVVPEGLISVFFVLSQQNSAIRYGDADKRKVVELALSMIDENGEFAGIYDISQGKIVATDRKVSALPILSAMLMMNNNGENITDAEIDSVMNRIIATSIVRVDDTLYYAPNGLSEDGVMNLMLDDLALNGLFFYLMNKYSLNPDRLQEEFGCAKLLEAYANSLQLVLEGQEMTDTRLPSSELEVTFFADGNYELQTSHTFAMEGPYFSMGLASYESFGQYLLDYNFLQNDNNVFNSIISKVAGDKEGNFNEKQSQYIREAAAMYSEFYNAYRIINTFYESWLDVYNFVKIQPMSTIYAPGYNVHTGEMIFAEPGAFYSEFAWMKPFRERFGTPAVSMNWFQLAGMFNDEKMMTDTASLAMNQYDIYRSRLLGSLNPDYSNPDLYAANGLNVWGYDSFKNVTANGLTATECTRYLFGTSGYSLNRENTDALIRRILNQYLDDAYQLGPDDAIPLFYDDIPSAVITKATGS